MININENYKLNNNQIENSLDNDPDETKEWIESIDALNNIKGQDRVRYIIDRLIYYAKSKNISLIKNKNTNHKFSTDYINTIPVEEEYEFPGNEQIEREYRTWIRWNAAILVHRAQRESISVGGHISTYASTSTLYEVGYNHFFRGKADKYGGDQVFFQGHASPGIYSRAFLEGRLNEKDLDGFRQEYSSRYSLSSYPHPRLMPNFWEFPTVSMGLGPMNAIYQAQFNLYLHNRGIKDTSKQKVWAFMGDGEMDEPESRGLIHLASNDNLDNLIFVINCNLQRLDGPVRGNGKIIQELESTFRGAGWEVIKVIWSREWDILLKSMNFSSHLSNPLVELMNKTLDGDYQTYTTESSNFIRKNFFNKIPKVKEFIKNISDNNLWKLKRGGHDYCKVYSAYKLATNIKNKPTVILAKTVKGYGLGSNFEARNSTHQMKKLNLSDLKKFRDYLNIPFSNKILENNIDKPPYYHPGPNNESIRYLIDRRMALGGFIPSRKSTYKPLCILNKKHYKLTISSVKNKKIATTMILVRILKELVKDKNIRNKLVIIIPDEARTFGMDSLFSTIKIYNPKGQKYISVDRNMLLSYKESSNGQIVHSGINEAGSVAMFTAVGSSYATHGEVLIPIYMFYSMFGFQRTGDSIWAATDQLTRGFLIGATAGKTTLAGEGLQHADGHSPLLALTNPAIIIYDLAYSYEILIVIMYGLKKMYGVNSNNYNYIYYITVYNEPINQRVSPKYLNEKHLIKGMYLLNPGTDPSNIKIELFASGISLPWILEVQKRLLRLWNIDSNVWSITSWSELRKDGLKTEEINILKSKDNKKQSFIDRQLSGSKNPVLAVSDYMKSVPDQIRSFIRNRFVVLGADGFGISDTRLNMRKYFKIDIETIILMSLYILDDEKLIDNNIFVSFLKKHKNKN